MPRKKETTTWRKTRAWEQKALEMAEQSELSVNIWAQQLKEFLGVFQYTMDKEVCKSRWVPSSQKPLRQGRFPHPQVNPWLWPLIVLEQVSCAEA